MDIDAAELKQKINDKGVQYDCLVLPGGHEWDVEDLCPDMYFYSSAHDERASKIAEATRQLEIPFTMVKTHHVVDCRYGNTVFLFREPLSCLTSTALLLNRAGIEKAPESINQTVAYFSDYYVMILKHYLGQKDQNSNNCFFLSHEILSTGAAAIQFQKMMKFFGFEVQLVLIEKVLERFPLRTKYNKKLLELISEETKATINHKFSSCYANAIRFASEQ